MPFVTWVIQRLGWSQAVAIEGIDVTLASPVIGRNFFWFALATTALGVLAIVYYRRLQQRGSLRWRTRLGALRGLLLVLVCFTLAAPVLRLTLVYVRPPTIFLLFDGTDSMAIEDDWSRDAQGVNRRVLGLTRSSVAARPALRSRHDYLRALILSEESNFLEQLRERTGAQLEAFSFEGHATSQLRRLEPAPPGAELPRPAWASQLSTSGQVTALGAALEDVPRQAGAVHLAAVIMFSDFAQNAGTSPVGDGPQGIAARLGVPVHTVGLGTVETSDLGVELLTDVKMKKAERTTLVARLRQTGFAGHNATVRLTARRRDAAPAGADVEIGTRTVTLANPQEAVEIPFTPEESGLWEFEAVVGELPGESESGNNRSVRQVQVIDDFLRLLYVAYEPEWEWRFIKEVFQRDRLVGVDGFRTFLASSDPRVREANPLFVDSLTSQRSEFFAHDVLVLGDMPASALTERFGEYVREFVGRHGGGLVVLAGPRFGPRELARSPIADLLPVILDPDLRLRDGRTFRLRRTPQAALFPFMTLAEDPAKDEQAWENLGDLPWYQPVAALHAQATVLAEHPDDTCRDGRTPQPLIVVRRYGQGEVVYLAFNETWRLRRKYGEQYYRRYWSQLIYRLGMSHALGEAKRFVPRVDRPAYRVDDEVTLTVDAYDADYEPLGDGLLPDQGLHAELIPPPSDRTGPTVALNVPLLRPGLFEARFPVYAAGAYRVRVRDPVTGRFEERRFEVDDTSAERRRVTRDLALQQELARQTGGQSYEFSEVDALARDLKLNPVVERVTRDHPVWCSPFWFVLIVGLMASEWLARRWMDLP